MWDSDDDKIKIIDLGYITNAGEKTKSNIGTTGFYSEIIENKG